MFTLTRRWDPKLLKQMLSGLQGCRMRADFFAIEWYQTMNCPVAYLFCKMHYPVLSHQFIAWENTNLGVGRKKKTEIHSKHSVKLHHISFLTAVAKWEWLLWIYCNRDSQWPWMDWYFLWFTQSLIVYIIRNLKVGMKWGRN